MKILLLGATGGTGQQVTSQALEQGHHVTAFVRDPQKLAGRPSDHLRMLTGSVEDDHALLAAARDQDVVVSTLGVGGSLKASGLIATSVPLILEAMKSQRVRRLIFTSAYGVGETMRDVPFVPRILMRTLLRDIYADKAAGETHLRRSDLDWTIVYPVTLTNGPRTGRCEVGERLALRGLPKVSRADVAAFILSQLSDTTYVRKGVLISQ